MPAEKKSKTVKKTSAAKGSKKSQVQKKQTPSGGNNTAFFVLVIIILVTIIILMFNRFYDKGKLKFPDFAKMIPAADDPKEKKAEPQKEKVPEKIKPVQKDETGKDEAVKDPAANGGDKRGDKPADIRKDVSVYLLKLDEKTERIYLSPVKRTVTEKDILASALENLIKGPTQHEKERGFITAVPSGLKIRSIAVNGRTAEIDFNNAIEEGAAGDILLKRVQQIVYTSTQFDSVNSIIIKINGQRRKSMGSDGFSIGGPLKR
jgi:spore germination protein GerM